jgi:antitoxin component of MazEF toxin-antitoxin module
MKIAAWGNSLAVRIPRSVVEASKLRTGMRVSVRNLDNGAILITPADQPIAVTHLQPPPELTPPESAW